MDGLDKGCCWGMGNGRGQWGYGTGYGKCIISCGCNETVGLVAIGCVDWRGKLAKDWLGTDEGNGTE